MHPRPSFFVTYINVLNINNKTLGIPRIWTSSSSWHSATDRCLAKYLTPHHFFLDTWKQRLWILGSWSILTKPWEVSEQFNMYGFYSFDIKYDALHKDLKHLQSHSTRKRLLTYHKMYSSCKIFSKWANREGTTWARTVTDYLNESTEKKLYCLIFESMNNADGKPTSS